MTIESSASDPYEVLGVGPDATEDQVRKAWRKKITAIGPGSATFAALNDAAELLLDADRRRAYDAEVAAKREAETAAATPLSDDAAEAPSAAADIVAPASPQPGATRAGMLSGWRGTAVVAGVIAVLAVALAVWQGISYATHDSPPAAPGTGGVAAGDFAQPVSVQTAVLSTVRTGLPAVLSYSYDSMAAAQANADRFLAPRLRTSLAASYQRLIAGGTPPGCTHALPPIATSKTVVTATVVQAGIVSVGANVAQVGAFVNQTTTTATQAAKTTQNRVLVSLVKQNGTWLIDLMSVPNTDGLLKC